MGKGQRCAFLDVGLYVVAVNLTNVLVRQKDHHDIRALDRIGHFGHLEAGLLGLVPGSATLAQTDRDLDAGFMQVERMCMTLRAVTNNRHLLALDQGKICIFVVKDLHRFSFLPLKTHRKRWARGATSLHRT